MIKCHRNVIELFFHSFKKTLFKKLPYISLFSKTFYIYIYIYIYIIDKQSFLTFRQLSFSSNTYHIYIYIYIYITVYSSFYVSRLIKNKKRARKEFK